MIWLAVCFFVVFLVCFIVKVLNKGDEDVERISFFAGLACFVVAMFFAVISSITIIKAGNVGVPTIFGKVINLPISEGLSFVNPFWNIHKMSIKTETYTMVSTPAEGAKTTGDDSIFTQTSDGIVMNMDVTVAYRLILSDAAHIYRFFGADYADTIVRASAKSALPDITSKYSFQDAFTTKRDELGFKVGERMNQTIRNIISEQTGENIQGIVVQSVMIRKIEPPKTIKASIEAKMAAEQEAERMKYVLLKEKQEAERKKIEAEGIQKFQTIVSNGINDNLLKWKGIEATESLAKSQNAKVVVIGSGKDGLPLILGGN